MKKLGFTLSEIIVTLCIIGVVAAITAPLIENLVPDKNKMMVLKYYKIINDINTDLLNDGAIYRRTNCLTSDPDAVCVGLGDDERPVIAPYNNVDHKFFGSAKYGHLLASKMNLVEEPNYASKLSYFKTQDNVQISVTRDDNSYDKIEGSTNEYGCDHYIELNLEPNNSDGCYYSVDSCKKPTIFKFRVKNNGRVVANDPLTNAYLSNPYKLNDKKKDLEFAKLDNTKYFDIVDVIPEIDPVTPIQPPINPTPSEPTPSIPIAPKPLVPNEPTPVIPENPQPVVPELPVSPEQPVTPTPSNPSPGIDEPLPIIPTNPKFPIKEPLQVEQDFQVITR